MGEKSAPLLVDLAGTADSELPLAYRICHVATDATEAVERFADQAFRTALVRWRDGCETPLRAALERCARLFPHTRWIALVDPDETDWRAAREFIADYCFDFHRLPVSEERLDITLKRAHKMAELSAQVAAQVPTATSEKDEGNTLVGSSVRMREITAILDKVGKADVPVLVTGETGTGKELAARRIHEHSARRGNALVEVNCGALPSTLIQSELFGHEKGAFTGADRRNVGRIEAADGGTLFLDEIGDLPLEAQANLLRFLQEGTIQRVGSTSQIHVDVRVVAATHVDLARAVAAKRFREDLYYRLNVLHVEMPPLRDRGEDIEQLSRFFLGQMVPEGAVTPLRLTSSALLALRTHRWPGNVRELKNRLQRAAVMASHGVISSVDLGLASPAEAKRDASQSLEQIRSRTEREAVAAALKSTNYNVSKAARHLDISRRTLYRLLERYDLSA